MASKKRNRGKSPQVGNPPDTSVGNSFAFAVGEILKQSETIKGSQTGFLGVPKETIDVKEFNHNLTGKK